MVSPGVVADTGVDVEESARAEVQLSNGRINVSEFFRLNIFHYLDFVLIANKCEWLSIVFIKKVKPIFEQINRLFS
ncbi:hypothetical protein CRN84_14910 [Budvicia aquatica]|uniref:Uncharacterized protein n=1 Tax=Budvicia aquatica TaxID=82979 RepID=A0A2C6DH57_9GAMM|nr:hypothetical protein CRN84_14910 [Budvicia aquatica]